MLPKHIGIRHWVLVALLLPSLTFVGQNAGDTIPEPQNKLDVTLQFLARGESRYGGLPLAKDGEMDSAAIAKSNFVQGRTRLVFDFKRDWLAARVTPQHSGIWGQSGKGGFNLYETWAKLTARNGLFAQVGRVALSYDDERIIGSDDWAMAALSHDIVRLGYEGHRHKAHLIAAYNQNAEVVNSGGSYYVNGAQSYKTMQTLWYHYDFGRLPLGASLLFMNIGMEHVIHKSEDSTQEEEQRTWFQHLLGGYLSYAPKHWNVELSYYRQFGKNEDGLKIDAWMASARTMFQTSELYGIVAGYDYLSGDKLFAVPPRGGLGMTRHDVIRGFSTVYGAHHKFYGAMDFFYVSAYVNGFTPGLQNAFVSGFCNPLKGFRIDASYHYLATATKLTNLDMTLGHEFEMHASYRIARDVNLSAGVSLMFGGETMKRLKQSSATNSLRWGWISLSVNPRILSLKW